MASVTVIAKFTANLLLIGMVSTVLAKEVTVNKNERYLLELSDTAALECAKEGNIKPIMNYTAGEPVESSTNVAIKKTDGSQVGKLTCGNVFSSGSSTAKVKYIYKPNEGNSDVYALLALPFQCAESDDATKLANIYCKLSKYDEESNSIRTIPYALAIVIPILVMLFNV